MMVENMMFNSLFLMQKNVLVYYKHQNGQLQLVVHLLHTQIKELLLAIQSLLMHLVHHIIVIYFMLHQEFSQGGSVSITVGRNIYNNDTVYPIAFNNLPSVNVINIADTLDQDGWVTSAIKSITNIKFTYMTAQNSVTGISWIAIGN